MPRHFFGFFHPPFDFLRQYLLHLVATFLRELTIFRIFHLCFQSPATIFRGSPLLLSRFRVNSCAFSLSFLRCRVNVFLFFHPYFREVMSINLDLHLNFWSSMILWSIFLLQFSRKSVLVLRFSDCDFRRSSSVFCNFYRKDEKNAAWVYAHLIIKAADLGAERAQKPRRSPSGRVVACFVNDWFISILKILIKNNEKRCQKIWREREKGSIFAALSVKNARVGGLERQPREPRYWRSNEVGERQRVAESFKIFSKKVAKKFGGYKNLQYFCTRFRQGSHTRVTESKKREQERRSLR